MFRFTIRDVLWLTVVVAVSVGWWMDRRATNARHNEQTRAMEQHAAEGWDNYNTIREWLRVQDQIKKANQKASSDDNRAATLNRP